MRMPQGWYAEANGNSFQHANPKYHDKDHFIQLKCNLYGCKQVARNWFVHLTHGLLHDGFEQSKIDPCLFIWQDCIMVVYTDDCLIFAKKNSTIDNLINSLSELYLLKDQGSVSDYLGIRITKENTTKSIHMPQAGLIESLLNDSNLLSCSKTKDTPSIGMGILYPDREGIPCQDSWNNQSVIGKLNCIAQSTKPGISFAVHQCACYSSNPTTSLELAIKHIGHYLLYTKDKGFMLQPNQNFKLDMYVDAVYADTWQREYSELHESALS